MAKFGYRCVIGSFAVNVINIIARVATAASSRPAVLMTKSIELEIGASTDARQNRTISYDRLPDRKHRPDGRHAPARHRASRRPQYQKLWLIGVIYHHHRRRHWRLRHRWPSASKRIIVSKSKRSIPLNARQLKALNPVMRGMIKHLTASAFLR